MNIEIRPATPEERKYAYTQDQESLEATGCIGHLRGDMGSTGMEFHTTWDDHAPDLKTTAFKAEFDRLINALRFDEKYGGMFKDRAAMKAYCRANPDSAFDGNYTEEYAFRIDSDDYSYILRCNPVKGDYNFYCYAYDREMLEEALQPPAKTINVLVVEPGKKPYMKEIQSDLASLQHEVDDYIQAIYPFDEPVGIICGEEAKLNGKELNRVLRDPEGNIYDVIAGTFLVAGLGAGDFISLSKEYIQKFSDYYKTPELFLSVDGRLVVIPMRESQEEEKTRDQQQAEGKQGADVNNWEKQRRQTEQYKAAYPPGTRILLENMGNDPYPVDANTRGTVDMVDSLGTVHCTFDNGRALGIIPGEDSFRKLTAAELAEEQKKKPLDEIVSEAETKNRKAEAAPEDKMPEITER